MSHYRSNVRDLEFNLFEVLGAGERMGIGPFAEMDAETARGVLHELEKVAIRPGRRVVRRRRPQPAGVRPGDLQRHPARVVQEVVQGAASTASGTAWNCPPNSVATAHPPACAGRPPS